MTDKSKPSNNEQATDAHDPSSIEGLLDDKESTSSELEAFEKDLFSTDDSISSDWLDDLDDTGSNTADTGELDFSFEEDDDLELNPFSPEADTQLNSDNEVVTQDASFLDGSEEEFFKSEEFIEKGDQKPTEDTDNESSSGDSEEEFFTSDETSSGDEPQSVELEDSKEDESFSFKDAGDTDISETFEEADPFADSETSFDSQEDAAITNESFSFEDDANADKGETFEEADPFADSETSFDTQEDVAITDESFSPENDTDTDNSQDFEEADPFADSETSFEAVDELGGSVEQSAIDEDDPFANENPNVQKEGLHDDFVANASIKTADDSLFDETLFNTHTESDFADAKTDEQEKIKKEQEPETMSKQDDREVLNQVAPTTETKPVKPAKSGVGLVGTAIISILSAGSAVFGYQEYLAPKNVITQEDLALVVSEITEGYEAKIAENEQQVFEQVLEDLRLKGVLIDDLDITLPEVAEIAKNAESLAYDAQKLSDENSDRISRNKKNHELLSNDYHQVTKELSADEEKFMKALKKLWIIKSELDKDRESSSKEIQSALEQAKQSKAETLAAIRDFKELSEKHEALTHEVERLKKQQSKPESKNKIQEALGLPATGINVVKEKALPLVQSKGVVNDMILIVRDGQTKVENYKVGDPLEGYGKILEIDSVQKTARTEKGWLNLKPTN